MTTHCSNIHHSTLFVQAIMDHPRDGETSSDRLRQIGMMDIISRMQEEGHVVTLQSLRDYMGDATVPVSDAIASLVARGLIVEMAAKSGEAGPAIAIAGAMQAAMNNPASATTIQ